MNALADSLVFAVTYINCLPDPAEEHLDGDVDALEGIAHYLQGATEDEKNELAQAAQRAFKREQAGRKRPEYLRDYGSWMEDMFGEPWTGNQRE